MNKLTTKDTLEQYLSVVGTCRTLFIHKLKDYGASWRVFRMISIADQLYIKACRIRQLQSNPIQMIDEGIPGEFMGLVNYGLIGLIQDKYPGGLLDEMSIADAELKYDEMVLAVKNLMLKKNHDYGEAWRDMSQESLVDLILVKLMRIRQILANNGETAVSEGVDGNLMDIVNYAVFALILIQEQQGINLK